MSRARQVGKLEGLRERHDALRRQWGKRSAQPGHPLRATVTIVVDGRTSLGRAAPRTFTLALDLLHGQASEAHLLREVQDAIEATFYADIHFVRRRAQNERLASRTAIARAEHEEWEAERRPGMTARGGG
jgi:hypothetical protein